MVQRGETGHLSNIQSNKVIKRQVFDLPLPAIEVTEYQSHSVICPCCEHKNTAAFPKGLNAPTQYGKNLQAFIGYLSTHQMIPHERISELIEDLCGHTLSKGSIICTHTFCNAHHLRELQGVIDNEKLIWVKDLYRLLIRMKLMVDKVKQKGGNRTLQSTNSASFEPIRYHHLRCVASVRKECTSRV